MALSRYDEVLWRINGTIIALVGVIALLFLVYGGYHLCRQIVHTRPADALVNFNEQTRREEFLTLRRFNKIRGTSILVAPLGSEDSSRNSFSSGGSFNTRNYLFYDAKLKSARWLFDNNSGVILDVKDIVDDITAERDKSKVTACIYEVVLSDSNGDSQLTSDDKKTIIYNNLSGTTATTLLKVDDVLGIEQVTTTEVLIFFKSDKKSYVASLNAVTGKVAERIELAMTQPTRQ